MMEWPEESRQVKSKGRKIGRIRYKSAAEFLF